MTYIKDKTIPNNLRRRRPTAVFGLTVLGAGALDKHGIDEPALLDRHLADNTLLDREGYSRKEFLRIANFNTANKSEVFWCIETGGYIVPTDDGLRQFVPPKKEIPQDKPKGEPIILPQPKNCTHCRFLICYYTDTTLCMHPKHVRNIPNKNIGRNCDEFEENDNFKEDENED